MSELFSLRLERTSKSCLTVQECYTTGRHQEANQESCAVPSCALLNCRGLDVFHFFKRKAAHLHGNAEALETVRAAKGPAVEVLAWAGRVGVRVQGRAAFKGLRVTRRDVTVERSLRLWEGHFLFKPTTSRERQV